MHQTDDSDGDDDDMMIYMQKALVDPSLGRIGKPPWCFPSEGLNTEQVSVLVNSPPSRASPPSYPTHLPPPLSETL